MEQTNPEAFDFIRYLQAKKTVDDRALHPRVLQSMARSLQLRASQQTEILHVLEVAAGIGTMFQRLVEWDLLPSVRYTMVDIHPKYIAQAKIHLSKWAKQQSFHVEVATDELWIFSTDSKRWEVSFQAAEVMDFFDNNQDLWDLVIAHAFLDLTDINLVLAKIFPALKTQGFFYFSINFDGETILLPEIEPTLDKQIVEEYHKAMEQKKFQENFVTGAQAGRKLFESIPKAGGEILSAGSSDWLVYAHNNKYPYQEDYFLHCIIDMIGTTLRERTSYDIEPWIAQRHQQIVQGKLVYIAHQLDFFGEPNASKKPSQ